MIANIWYERSFAGEKRVAGIFSYTCLSLILTRLHHGFMSLRRVSKRLRVQDENAGITASTGVPNRKSDTTPQILQVYCSFLPPVYFHLLAQVPKEHANSTEAGTCCTGASKSRTLAPITNAPPEKARALSTRSLPLVRTGADLSMDGAGRLEQQLSL